ncbi:unnamed protein product [Diabrotica balteata]|uniref:Uncharacterized protein n=1 Tax=Diabrotica balteata TaxID=107213 RepID=A0A9N9TD14_DIABA|nr:unnamed protein product [Diabrotica balteata]
MMKFVLISILVALAVADPQPGAVDILGGVADTLNAGVNTAARTAKSLLGVENSDVIKRSCMDLDLALQIQHAGNVVFCNIVYIQCSPYHLFAFNDDNEEDHFNDVDHFEHNLPNEAFVDNDVDDLRNRVALRSSGIGGIIAGLGQMANGVVDVLGKGAVALIGTGRDPPTIVVHQPPPPPIVVPAYPNQVPIPIPVPCCS